MYEYDGEYYGNRASIILTKIRKNNEIPPPIYNFLYINILNWYEDNIIISPYDGSIIKLFELSTHSLKTELGFLFENYWQAHKLYKTVPEQYIVRNNTLLWSHPAETHLIEEKREEGEDGCFSHGRITDEYFIWRYKLMKNEHGIKFPANKDNGNVKVMPFCYIWYNMQSGRWEEISYVAARHYLYIQKYIELVKSVPAYHQLKTLIDNGYNLQIADLFLPPTHTAVTEEAYNFYIQKKSIQFGHAWALAIALLDLKI